MWKDEVERKGYMFHINLQKYSLLNFRSYRKHERKQKAFSVSRKWGIKLSAVFQAKPIIILYQFIQCCVINFIQSIWG